MCVVKLERRPVIPREELKSGIADCFAQSRELLESADLLAANGKARAAAELFVHATQELERPCSFARLTTAGLRGRQLQRSPIMT